MVILVKIYMQVVILAAGKGTRLGNLTADTPKPLVLLGGIPLIGWTIKSLLKISSVSEIIVVSGYLHEKIEDYIKEEFSDEKINDEITNKNKIKLVYNDDFEEGSVLTINKARDLIKEDFLILNADHLFSIEAYKKMINELNESNGVIISSYSHRKPLLDEMKVKFNEDGSVEMSKSLENYDCGYPGITAVSKECTSLYFACAEAALNSVGRKAVVENIIPLLSKKAPVSNCDLSSFDFIEVDTQEDYENAQKQINFIHSPSKNPSSAVKEILKNKQAIIFDLDGTLIDTMFIFADVAADLISRRYYIHKEEARKLYLQTCGLPFKYQLASIFPGNNLNEETEKLFEEKKLEATSHIKINQQDYDDLLNLKEQGYLLIISSNNFQKNVDNFTAANNMDHIFSLALGYKENFSKGQNHFNHLIKELGLNKENLVFVGDSLNDLRLAIENKIDFIAKLDTFSVEDFQRIDNNIQHIKKINELL